MTLEELEQSYGEMPPNLDKAKLKALLKKRENKFAMIPDFKQEVVDFLSANELKFTTEAITVLNLQNKEETIKSINVDSLVLVLIDDYKVFNKKNVPKDTATKVHKSLVAAGKRVIWIKKFEWENTNKKNVLKYLILHCLGKTHKKRYERNKER